MTRIDSEGIQWIDGIYFERIYMEYTRKERGQSTYVWLSLFLTENEKDINPPDREISLADGIKLKYGLSIQWNYDNGLESIPSLILRRSNSQSAAIACATEAPLDRDKSLMLPVSISLLRKL